MLYRLPVYVVRTSCSFIAVRTLFIADIMTVVKAKGTNNINETDGKWRDIGGAAGMLDAAGREEPVSVGIGVSEGGSAGAFLTESVAAGDGDSGSACIGGIGKHRGRSQHKFQWRWWHQGQQSGRRHRREG